MADKIDSLKIGSTSYDIDLPPDAAPSIASLTVSGTTNVSAGTLKAKTINIPTSSGGSTYGPGTSGQILTSNGTTVYWANASSGANYYHTPAFNSGLKIGTGTGVNDLYVPNASSSQAGVVTTGSQTFSGQKTFTQSIYTDWIQCNNTNNGLYMCDSGDENTSIFISTNEMYINANNSSIDLNSKNGVYIGMTDYEYSGNKIFMCDPIEGDYHQLYFNDSEFFIDTSNINDAKLSIELSSKTFHWTDSDPVTYNYTFPDKSGTIALTSDIPTVPTNYVTTDTAQTITGTKTFSSNILPTNYNYSIGNATSKFGNGWFYSSVSIGTGTSISKNLTEYKAASIVRTGTTINASYTINLPNVTASRSITLPIPSSSSDVTLPLIGTSSTDYTQITRFTSMTTGTWKITWGTYKLYLFILEITAGECMPFLIPASVLKNLTTSSSTWFALNTCHGGVNRWLQFYYTSSSMYVRAVTGIAAVRVIGIN